MSDPAWAVAMRSRIAELEAKLQEEAAREPAPSTTHSPSIVSELAPSKKQSAPSVAGVSLQVARASYAGLTPARLYSRVCVCLCVPHASPCPLNPPSQRTSNFYTHCMPAGGVGRHPERVARKPKTAPRPRPARRTKPLSTRADVTAAGPNASFLSSTAAASCCGLRSCRFSCPPASSTPAFPGVCLCPGRRNAGSRFHGTSFTV